jgi:hypothetical protein
MAIRMMFFPIGGLVGIGETPIAVALRYLRELAGFRLARNFAMFICNGLSGYKEHEPIKISLLVIDVLWDILKYRNNYHALTLGNEILADKLTQTCANLEIQHEGNGEVVPFVCPNIIQCPMLEEVTTKVHHLETNDIKSNGFVYFEMYTAYQIKENLGADAGIIPMFHDKNAMRDFSDENGLWAAKKGKERKLLQRGYSKGHWCPRGVYSPILEGWVSKRRH